MGVLTGPSKVVRSTMKLENSTCVSRALETDTMTADRRG